MIALREGQRQVAAYRSGYLAVPAVPGAGKTTVLAYLAASLIEEKCIGTGKILIVTYMTSSAANFKARIADFLEKKGLPKTRGYEVRTLHSLAVNILKERPERVLMQEELQVLEETLQDRVIRDFTMAWIDENYDLWKNVIKTPEQANLYARHVEDWKRETVKLAKEMVRYFKSNGISAKEARLKTAALPADSFLRWSVAIFEQYQQWMVENGVVDFEDMIYQAVLLLREDPELLTRLQERWTYIFEDEAQDSNPLQEEILKLLAGTEGNLLRVGDSNQAIMGTFTSAEPALFRDFCRIATAQPILVASRSSMDIIELANYLVAWSTGENPVAACREALENQRISPVGPEDEFPNPQPDKYVIAAPSFATDTEEIQKICQHALGYSTQNPGKTVAILAPADYMLQEVANTLAGMGVNFYELTRLPRERQRTAEDVDAILRFLARPQDSSRCMQMLIRLVPELVEDDNHALRSWLERERLEDLLFSLRTAVFLENLPEDFKNLEIWPVVKDALGKVRGWLAICYLSPDALTLCIADQLALSGEEREIAARMALDMKSRLEQNPALRLDTLLLEMDAVKNVGNRFANIVFERRGYTPKAGVINLVTCHKAKGLEWDMVYIIATTAAEYPCSLKDRIRSELWFLKDEVANPAALAKAELRALFYQNTCKEPLLAAKTEVISERLRLLYVAITRARESLIISTHKQASKYNRKVQPAAAYEALRQFIEQRRLQYDR